jgi:hypothetical protein
LYTKHGFKTKYQGGDMILLQLFCYAIGCAILFVGCGPLPLPFLGEVKTFAWAWMSLSAIPLSALFFALGSLNLAHRVTVYCSCFCLLAFFFLLLSESLVLLDGSRYWSFVCVLLFFAFILLSCGIYIISLLRKTESKT